MERAACCACGVDTAASGRMLTGDCVACWVSDANNVELYKSLSRRILADNNHLIRLCPFQQYTPAHIAEKIHDFSKAYHVSEYYGRSDVKRALERLQQELRLFPIHPQAVIWNTSAKDTEDIEDEIEKNAPWVAQAKKSLARARWRWLRTNFRLQSEWSARTKARVDGWLIKHDLADWMNAKRRKTHFL